MAKTIALAWAVPAAALLVALIWLLPSVGGSTELGSLSYAVFGTLVVQAIWVVWAVSLAVMTTALVRTERLPGRIWRILQCVLLGIALIRASPVLLADVAVPVERALTTGPVWIVMPVLVLLLSAVQGILLFLAA